MAKNKRAKWQQKITTQKTEGKSFFSEIGRRKTLLFVLYQYNWPPRYDWNIVESGDKHHNLNPNSRFLFLTQLSISCFRVGVMLDGWMHPVDEEVYKNISQPLLMINMETFQWQENVDQMQRLQQDPNVYRPMITIKWVHKHPREPKGKLKDKTVGCSCQMGSVN